MRKGLLAGVIAVVAAAGAIAAVVVSSHGGKGAQQGGQSAATGATTSGDVPVLPPPSTTSPVPTTTAALLPPPPSHGPRLHDFVVGTVDDSVAQQDAASTDRAVQISRRAGFDALVLTVTWKQGLTTPSAQSLRGVENAARSAKRNHVRLFLVVWHGSGASTPRGAAARAQFAQFAAGVARAVPQANAVIVGNEPNLNTFWLPQFGPGGRDVAAAAYEDLLARTYDELKAADPHLRVIGAALSPRGADRPQGIRPTHSPTAFIRDLGVAYRASGRTRPLMDAFSIHPYMLTSAVPPTVAHTKTTQITIADYPKLVTLLDEAFRGTPQRGRTLPILYTEFGVQTTVPPKKRSAYEAANVPEAVHVSPELQGAYYRKALALAYCQPTVRGLFVFHTFDELSLAGWQSGLYYADHTPKPSLDVFRKAVADLRAGRLTTCR